MNHFPFVFLLAGLLAFALPTYSQEVSGTSSIKVPESLVREGRAAIDRGVDWLVANQSDNGSFSNPKFPALTALPLWAMCESGRADSAAAKKAAKFVASCAKADGSIYVKPDIDQKGGGLVNYNTAICMTALHLTGDEQYRPLVLKARAFVAASQHLGGDIYKGGFGYDAKTARSYTDLLNTSTTVEAMRITESAEDYRPAGQAKVDINWKELEKYVQRSATSTPKSNARTRACKPQSIGSPITGTSNTPRAIPKKPARTPPKKACTTSTTFSPKA